ncbi:hypothetical protein F9288_05950 [Sphingomonas sp. CL5.1]|uniref:hypothetical protein n=1 Tax=Sphingomonas sp. CL5.1 TaxID=2653203 RepID=UPI0015815205|nr:hypothetical protein [Sphingomonas sp. CL5.1]QKR99244.1 hypothetical protein F9288_05950 [Sphingomonas sp. CL5.1]
MRHRIGIPNANGNWTDLDTWLADNEEWAASARDIGGAPYAWRAIETDDDELALVVKMRFGRMYGVEPGER